MGQGGRGIQTKVLESTLAGGNKAGLRCDPELPARGRFAACIHAWRGGDQKTKCPCLHENPTLSRRDRHGPLVGLNQAHGPRSPIFPPVGSSRGRGVARRSSANECRQTECCQTDVTLCRPCNGHSVNEPHSDATATLCFRSSRHCCSRRPLARQDARPPWIAEGSAQPVPAAASVPKVPKSPTHIGPAAPRVRHGFQRGGISSGASRSRSGRSPLAHRDIPGFDQPSSVPAAGRPGHWNVQFLHPTAVPDRSAQTPG